MERLKSAMTGATGVALMVVLLGSAGAGDAAAAKDRTRAKDARKASKTEARSGGYIGIHMQELTDEVMEGLNLKGVTKGVLVSGVEDDGPAAAAGLEEGDVIVSFSGKAVTSPDELRSRVLAADPESSAKLGVVREGKELTIEVTVGERPSLDYGFRRMINAPEIAHAFSMIGGRRLGVKAHEIENDDIASYFDVKAGSGVLVLDVDEGSVAEKAGVKPGDVLQAIDGEKVSSVGDIRDACREMEEGDEFTIGVLRHGKNQELKATMDESSPTWAFRGDGNRREWRHAPRALVVPPGARDEMRRELDELRRELEQLKQQMKDSDS